MCGETASAAAHKRNKKHLTIRYGFMILWDLGYLDEVMPCRAESHDQRQCALSAWEVNFFNELLSASFFFHLPVLPDKKFSVEDTQVCALK